MNGILITYQYSGDEAAWEKVTGDFVAAIKADKSLNGGFSYTVTKAREGDDRTHLGHWRDDETLKLMQSSAYFQTFAAAMKELTNDSTTPQLITVSSITTQ